jgi:DNA-directed RNA polymerase specialized sigma24 family protein
MRNTKPPVFPETNWSLLKRAGDPIDEVRQKAVQDILIAYYPLMITHIARRFRLPPDAADNLAHEFITQKLLLKGILRHVDRNIGRFRSYLVHVLGNFVISELRRQGRHQKYYVDPSVLDHIPDDSEAWEISFDHDWAAHLFNGALVEMEADCETLGRQDIWNIFQLRIIDPIVNEKVPMPYNDLVKQLNLNTPRQAINLLTTAKRVFQRHVRKQLSYYTPSTDEIDCEFADFREILLRKGIS